MKMRSLMTGALLIGGLLGAAIQPAAASQVVYDAVGFAVGQQSFSDTFAFSSPGTLTVTLSNMTWPQPLASLNMIVTTPNGLLGPEMGAGTDSFAIAGGTMVTVQWFATAQGPLDAGVFGMNIETAPSTLPVPLPTSIALFLSGLSLLAWQRRTRPEAEFEYGEHEFDAVTVR